MTAEHIYWMDNKVNVTVLAYFNYFQCQAEDDNGTIAKMRVLDIHGANTKPIVTAHAYSNYFQCRTMENTGSIERYHVMLRTKDPESAALFYGFVKMMDKTQET